MKYIFIIIYILLFFNIAFSFLYEVGPLYTYENIGDVPLESLMPGDTVFIHWRDISYNEKWVICRTGIETAPIVFLGVPNEFGELPIIDGRDATTRSELNFWNEERGIIKIGGANSPPDTMPAYIIIENLDIRSGRPPYSFIGRSGLTDYVNNCAAIYIEKGEHIIIRRCNIHDCGNGIFAGHSTMDLVVEYNYIYDNGIEDDIYEHNNYTEVFGILFQFNHFGPLRDGCLGNNLKDRSAGTIIRYNWIESGNRQLDLVDSDYDDFIDDSLYRKTFVYGNILVEHDGDGNSQIIHYGGDSGDETQYRKGTLYLYNNTIISTRSGNTTLIRLSSNDETCDARNNIIYISASGAYLGMLSESGGILNIRNNFIKPGWVNSHDITLGTVNDYGNMEEYNPYFIDYYMQNYELSDSSLCIDAGTELAEETIPDNIPQYEYIRHCIARLRPEDTHIDIGAYEYSPGSIIENNYEYIDNYNISIIPNPFNSTCEIKLEYFNNGNRIEVSIY
ncbi:hypothetical protein J7L68_01295, partial [bacterium]|nr:hypothetical protein [bacterium]